MGDRVVVKPFPVEMVTKGGIVIPDNIDWGFDMGQCSGVVVAVGPGRKTAGGGRKPMSLRVGDRVRYQKIAEVMVPGSDFVMIQEADVLGVIEVGAEFSPVFQVD
jgi:chaperonin GroES